jgi:hypothetical protein
MDFFTALPTWQFVLVATAGAMTIFTSLYLLRRGYIAPIASVIAVSFVGYMLISRFGTPSYPPSDSSYSQYDVFRQMEPADQTRVNPWMGILQEDVYANRTGPIGDFVGNDDYVKNAPLYLISSEAKYEKGISARNCPTNARCTCIPVPGDPKKTHCGYIQNGTFIACPSDCCTPACTY